jgi:hypothetical protein
VEYTIQQLPGAFRYAREFVRSGNVTYNTVGARDYEAMGINWMGQKGLSQAIPPAYTELIGRQILSQIAT